MIDWLIDSLIDWLIHSFIHWLIFSFFHWFIEGWDQEDDCSTEPDDWPEHDDGDGEGEHDEHGADDGSRRLDQLALLWVRHNQGGTKDIKQKTHVLEN